MNPRIIIIGGGFFGVCLALFLRSISKDVTILEREDELMTQASLVNQARVHTGFHYPRSFATAKRSLLLHQRFKRDFAPAIEDEFQMLYAIARSGSKVTASRFESMFRQLGAPIRPASPGQAALFDPDKIEQVFQCDEAAFDATILRDILSVRLEENGIHLVMGVTASGVERNETGKPVVLTDAGESLVCDYVFNATYARLNHVRLSGSSHVMPVKNEIAEVALVTPPPDLEGLAVTVLDGPFFSIMPFPPNGCHSLTHVRYTPHFAWHYENGTIPDNHDRVPTASRWLQMVRDAERYMPCMAKTVWRESLFVTKTVLEMNENDDGRPIFLSRHPELPQLISIMGAKIDNIYDLFSMLPEMETAFAGATTERLFGRTGA